MIIGLNNDEAIFADYNDGQGPEDEAGDPKDISDIVDAVGESAGVDVEGTRAYVSEITPTAA